jgi:hypothetical protein
LLTAFYLGWFLILWSGLFLVLTFCVWQARNLLAISLHRRWRPVLGAAAVIAAAVVPFLLIYLSGVRGSAIGPCRVGLSVKLPADYGAFYVTARWPADHPRPYFQN